MKKKMEELRLILNKIYIECGNTEEMVRISQELDDYIVMEQKKEIESKERKVSRLRTLSCVPLHIFIDMNLIFYLASKRVE